ncbi:MAG: hypothetical protein E7Z87_01180 [Cyanobacteria bacterium SIG26]|nr:hypothetical protein [Cyanobacteria bacterium SIG26]
MAVEFGKNLINAFSGTSSVKSAQATSVNGAQTTQSYKTTGYASIPYERAPEVADWCNANKLLGTDCPTKFWVA